MHNRCLYIRGMVIGFSVVVAACADSGSSKSKSDIHKSQNFTDSYSFEFNGCKTGKHTFQSVVSQEDVSQQICAALQDDSLNNFCAEDQRAKYFEKRCAGVLVENDQALVENTPIVQKPIEQSPVEQKDDAATVREKHYSDSYQFSLNGCKTGAHSFASTKSQDEVNAQLCQALQDEEKNNFCAGSLRQEYFTRKCPNLVWEPKTVTGDTNKVRAQNNSFAQENHKLIPGAYLKEQVLTTGRDSFVTASTSVMLTCAESLKSAVATGNNGFLLFAGSQAITIRPKEAKLGTDNFVITNCEGTREEPVTSPEIEMKALTIGESVTESIVKMPEGLFLNAAGKFNISCQSDTAGDLVAANGGLALGSKSMVAVRRGDEAVAGGAAKILIVKCE